MLNDDMEVEQKRVIQPDWYDIVEYNISEKIMRNIYIYKDETESQVQQFFENADEKLRNKFKSILNYLSNDKNPLCEPYVKHISVGRYRELY